jgi:mono/diheme cytochrome c family protein
MRVPWRQVAAQLASVLLSAGVAAVATAADTTGAARANMSDSNGLSSGADIYSHICQGCHMSQGEGAIGAGHYPKLAQNPALASWQYVAVTVLEGRTDMPAFADPPDMAWDGGPPGFGVVHLSDAQVADVVNYLRSHFGNSYKDRVTASDVAKLPHPGNAKVP